MEGSLTMDAADEQALAAKLGPDTLFGRTVADRRTWLLMLRTLAIVSGHPRSTGVLINDVNLIADPRQRVGQLHAWLAEMLIGDPAAAAAGPRALRERMAKRWGRWQGWDDDALSFAMLSIGDGVIFAAQTLKGSPLSRPELDELYEGVEALARLTGVDDAAIPDGYDEFRRYMDEQLAGPIARQTLHDVVAGGMLPAPPDVPGIAWTVAQAPSRHVAGVFLAATLPDVTKERLGVRQSAVGRAEWATCSLAMRAFGHLPERVRLVRAARVRRGAGSPR